MKKNILYFLIGLLTYPQIIKSQSKPENYYNSNFEKITRIEFLEISKQKSYSYNKYDLDDQVANILYQPKTKGKLTTEEFISLKKHLGKNQSLLDGVIIIIYYPGKDRCNKKTSNSQWNIFDKDFMKDLKKLNVNNLFWVYKNDEDLKYYYPKKINWKKMKINLLKKLFLKCNTHVLAPRQ